MSIWLNPKSKLGSVKCTCTFPLSGVDAANGIWMSLNSGVDVEAPWRRASFFCSCAVSASSS